VNVGLAHDYLLVMRGAERTFAEMAECWPGAPIYTTIYDHAGTEGRFEGHAVRPSFLQHARIRQRGFRRLLPLFPRAVERLPVQEHDLLVSSSSAFAHGIRPREGSVHVCYCHNPFRYVWHERERGLAELPRGVRPVVARQLERIKRWDLEAAARVSRYLANGEITRQRIGDFYGREATVVHPPVEVERFQRAPAPEDWFLLVGEVVAHKRVELALEAARLAGTRVRVVGEGPEAERLAVLYGDVAEFLGRVDDGELEELYSRALALVLPNVEEFGIAAVEAQAAGRPVLAVDAGGARETVVAGETGLLVPQTADALGEAMREVDFAGFDVRAARANAQRFSADEFRSALRAEVDRALD
jgi:glycosyltransferase involved in cell wall biosynthesis